jgi:Fe-S-cluster-containing dehydrogenase component
MTRWAWVIDQTRCIGCHACTTACKAENEVPLGVFRTWVKNVDVGTFPAVRRHFAVLRCNHCENAPCVTICPVKAMYQRADGLVDFDEDLCIGCKACMQACPYDAIYMDPDSNTAAKCNFCSHRVDQQLLPACVVVCPVEALLFGDVEDPTSAVSRALARHPVTVRRAEQATKPHAFYIGAHEATLDPLAARHDGMYAWADDRSAHPPIRRNGNGHLPARVAYDIPRQRVWAGKVSSYIWTKSLAAGAGLVAAVWHILGGDMTGPLMRWVAPALGLGFLGLTGALLVADLKRPERFWTILVRPQWRSWLARGAFVITAYGAVLAGWAAASWFGAQGAMDYLAWPLVLLAVLTAVYTAALFNQCEGRDLWQSRLLSLHLAVHAPVAALAGLLLVAPLVGDQANQVSWGEVVTGGLLVAGVLALVDGFGRHGTANARAAARALVRGPFASLFWAALVVGAALPAALFVAGPVALYPAAAALALGGLWLYGHALVLAGQGPPIS